MTTETMQAIATIATPIVVVVTSFFLYLQGKWAKKDTNERFDKADKDSKEAHAAIGTRIEGVEKRVGSVESTLTNVAGDVKFLAGRIQGRQDAEGK